MPVASENEFPKIIIKEGSAPTAAASGDQKLFVDNADHLLKLINASGIIDEILPPIWLVDIIPTISEPSAVVGSWNPTYWYDGGQQTPFLSSSTGSVLMAGISNGAGALNDSIEWVIGLSKGTWNLTIWFRKSTNTAIVTAYMDNVSIGTFDTYASPVYVKLTITGFIVPNTGKHILKLKATSKNASSSGYVVNFFSINLRRTS